ncbi:hypothetical protein OESDEN_13235 [Oesophagostomum dentatum]|uniref:SXP/RAL-2 family protein Ani s 5-like cation-binding domain-containing protein n=1 Tax=Oesophagostomum dentatum TaxID=61180 RepID=A0A0B1SPX5_OESDE|nr:hypothetical protein OESDEN_13235 [Oesophagostomum dentatum]
MLKLYAIVALCFVLSDNVPVAQTNYDSFLNPLKMKVASLQNPKVKAASEKLLSHIEEFAAQPWAIDQLVDNEARAQGLNDSETTSLHGIAKQVQNAAEFLFGFHLSDFQNFYGTFCSPVFF